jgi:dihydroflavonol-4-reductase
VSAARRAVFLTGATGFVGVELARELHARGHELYVFARRSADRAQLAGIPVRWRDGDLRDAAALEAALADVCARRREPWVVHNAAVISYRTRDRELQRAANVEGTRNVVEACRRQRVGRLLHVSSVVAVGQAPAGGLIDERAEYNLAPVRCDYADTKRAAEELALGAAADVDVIAVNPGAIFGVGARVPNTLKFLQQLAHGPRLVFTPPGSLSVVGVRDVVLGCLAALERGRRGERYLLVESAWTAFDAFSLAARLLGAPRPLASAPRPLWSALELGLRGVDLLAPLDLLTPQSARMLGVHFRCDSGKARSELGWSAEPFESVLVDVIARLRSRRAL